MVQVMLFSMDTFDLELNGILCTLLQVLEVNA